MRKKEEPIVVEWLLHYQAIIECPKCHYEITIDLDDTGPNAVGITFKCDNCKCELELG